MTPYNAPFLTASILTACLILLLLSLIWSLIQLAREEKRNLELTEALLGRPEHQQASPVAASTQKESTWVGKT